MKDIFDISTEETWRELGEYNKRAQFLKKLMPERLLCKNCGGQKVIQTVDYSSLANRYIVRHSVCKKCNGKGTAE